MKTTHTYEPQLKYIFGDYTEGVNANIIEVIVGMNPDNFIWSIRLLKNKWGCSYTTLSSIMGVHGSAIRRATHYGTTENVIAEDRITEAIIRLQMHFLGESFVGIDVIAEKQEQGNEGWI